MRYELVNDDSTILARTSDVVALAREINMWVADRKAPISRLNVRHYYDDTKPEASHCYGIECWALMQTFVTQAKLG